MVDDKMKRIFKPDVEINVEVRIKYLFIYDVLRNNPQYKYVIDLLDMSDPNMVWSTLSSDYVLGDFSVEECTENIKKYLL